MYISFDKGHVICCTSKCIGLQPRSRKHSRLILSKTNYFIYYIFSVIFRICILEHQSYSLYIKCFILTYLSKNSYSATSILLPQIENYTSFNFLLFSFFFLLFSSNNSFLGLLRLPSNVVTVLCLSYAYPVSLLVFQWPTSCCSNTSFPSTSNASVIYIYFLVAFLRLSAVCDSSMTIQVARAYLFMSSCNLKR